MKLSDLPTQEPVIIQVYSMPGVGKSEFLASANTSRAILFTDLNGIRTFRNERVRKLYPKFNPELEIIKPDESVTKPRSFNQMKDRVDFWFSDESRRAMFDWILIDDMTFIQRMAMYEAVSINSQHERSKTLSKAAAMHEALLPTEADFGTQMGLVESFISDLTAGCRHFGKSVIVACHEKQAIVKDKKTKEETLVAVVPLFTGRAAPANNSGAFDFVFRMSRVGKGATQQVQFQCHPDDIYVAKDRDSIFKPVELNLTVEKILNRIAESRKNFPQGEEQSTTQPN